jgi:hypothetical protein
MPSKSATPSLAAFLLVGLIAFTACSTEEGAGGPKRGTAEWYWSEAETEFAKGDYEDAIKALDVVAGADSELKQRAMIWMLTIHGGLARGYKDLGKAYAEGVQKLEKAEPALVNKMNQYRRDARQHTIAFTEGIGNLKKVLADSQTVALQFPFPEGKAEPSEALAKLADGDMPNPAQLETATPYTVQRGLVLQAADLAGADQDAEKARGVFASSSPAVPVSVFMLGLADSLWELSDLFGREQLNQPDIQGALLNNALDCLKPAVEQAPAEGAEMTAEQQDLKKKAEALQEKIAKMKKERMI